LTRYLILAEGFSADAHYGKTMRGVLRYRRDDVVAILDSARAPGDTEDGVPVVASLDEALRLEPTTALVGVATQGGRFPPAWRELIRGCIEHGLDIENGLHEFLADDPALRDLAARHGAELRDLRRPPADLSTATGANLDVPATIVLTVGSDCAIGKMTVALELDLEARRRGMRSLFVPTGQTGIAIAGWGIAVDAVVADFIAGAAERLVVEGAERGGELLWVEGQGSIVHPVYSGVTLGLFHGSAPHLLLLCHEAGRTEIEGVGGGPPCRCGRRAWPRSPSTRGRWTRPAPGPPSRRPRRRRGSRPTIPSASAPGSCSTPSPSSASDPGPEGPSQQTPRGHVRDHDLLPDMPPRGVGPARVKDGPVGLLVGTAPADLVVNPTGSEKRREPS
jgi:uncharacterized NAD-dependent epimerase/dehydratase family protein